MGRLIPATGLLDPTASDYDQQAAFTSMFGASGGLVQKGYDTIVSAGNGKWGNAAMQALPRSFTSAAKAIDMATTGKYQDSKGNYVTHATGFEAFVKALDGNPARIADEQRIKMQAVSAKDLQAGVQKRINDRMLDALDGRDQAAQQEIRKEVRQWNAEHPEYPIKINRSSIRRKMRAKQSDWRDRTHMISMLTATLARHWVFWQVAVICLSRSVGCFMPCTHMRPLQYGHLTPMERLMVGRSFGLTSGIGAVWAWVVCVGQHGGAVVGRWRVQCMR